MMSFPHIIDSTMLSTLRSCPRKFHYQYVECYSSNTDPSVDLHAGAALAHSLEHARHAYINGADEQEIVDIAVASLHSYWGSPTLFADTGKNLMKMDGAIRYYLEQYPIGNDDCEIHVINDVPCIEIPFQNGLDVRTPDDKDILFVGRPDVIVEHAGGLWLMDEKTTGSSLSYNWGDQWTRRGQFIGYLWAIQKSMGIELDGVIVRGLAIQKTQYSHKTKLIPVPRHLQEEWVQQTKLAIQSAISQYQSGQWLSSFGEHCHSYGRPCEYLRTCNSPDPSRVLSQYKRLRWNPINRSHDVIAD